MDTVCNKKKLIQEHKNIDVIVKEIFMLAKNRGANKIVFVHGNFNVLHSGHLRFLDFSSSCGDFLVVAINSDTYEKTLVPENLRLVAVQAVEYVDFAFLLNGSLENFIAKLQPNIVVKGREFKEKANVEKKIIESYGGKLIFSSGEIKSSDISLLRKEFSEVHVASIVKPIDYLVRHNFTVQNLTNILKKFSNLNVVVVGDLIVDEYVFCDAIGMSQEDPTIVVKPNKKELFVGGAGIVSAHASMLGSQVTFFTCTNKDEYSDFAEHKLKNYGVKVEIIVDETRRTTVKRRYKALSKTLLRVNHMQEHDISQELCQQHLKQIKLALEDANLLIFSDFNYGVLPQILVEQLIEHCNKKSITIAADSQSSSQLADISRYKNVNLITPTEREARLAVQDFKSGIACLTDSLITKTNVEHLLLTLGHEGVLICHYDKLEKCLKTDRLPAFNCLPRDVSGAGDSLLTGTALSLAVGANIWQAAYLGSLVAAFQVSRTGNIPITMQELLEELMA